MKITMLTSALLVFSLGASAQIIGTVPAAKVRNSACSNGQVPTYDANKRLTGCAGSAGAATLTKTWFPYGALPGPTNVGVLVTPNIGFAQRLAFFALTIPTARTISRLIAYVNGGAGNQAWGIYNSACNLVATSQTIVAVGNSVVKDWTFTPFNVPAGDYYLAFTSTAVNDTIYGVDENSVGTLGNANLSSPNLSYFFGNFATGSTTLTFPATCGVQTAMPSMNWARPAVALR